MLMIISPAKTLDYESSSPTTEFTMPELLDESRQLINLMKQKDSFEIAELMKISMKLADLNTLRFRNWHTPFTPENAKQALFAFKGDVYTGLDAMTLTPTAVEFTQNHLRTLSGLYGLLRPLDLMQAYRLEMGTRLTNERGKNLYDFWGSIITDQLNRAIHAQGDNILINLASNEYFKAIKPRLLNARIITPQFKEKRGNSYKIISFSAKKARGLMSRYIIDNRIIEPEAIKTFDLEEYSYNSELSEGDQWVFSR